MAASITRGKTFGASESVTNTKLHTLVDDATIANIDQTNMASNVGTLHRSTTAPSDTDAIWYDTTNLVLKVYNGSSWDAIALTSDKILRGFELTYKGTGDLYVEPGTLLHGTARVNKTARTTLTLATDSDWIDGSAPSITSDVIYIYIDSSGNIKLDETAPDKADTSGNTVGTLLYYYYTAGTKYYRCIGAITTDSGDNIIRFQQNGTWMLFTDPDGDADLQVIDVTENVSTFTAVDCSAIVPTFGTIIKLESVWSGGSATHTVIQFRPTGSAATNGVKIGAWNAADGSGGEMVTDVLANSTPSFDYKASFGSADYDAYIYGYRMAIR